MELLLIIFTVGYLFQHFASFVLIRRILQKKSVDGLSQETQILFLFGAFARCIWVFDTRLMYFPLIWLELILSVCFSVYILYLFHKYKHTIYNQIQNPFSLIRLLLICTILSFFFHPGDKGKYYMTLQMLVSLTMYLEAIGMLPQLYLIRKTGAVELNTGHYIILLALSRVIRLCFWLEMFRKGDLFLYLIIADLLHSIMVADFIYYYFKNKKGNLIILN